MPGASERKLALPHACPRPLFQQLVLHASASFSPGLRHPSLHVTALAQPSHWAVSVSQELQQGQPLLLHRAQGWLGHKAGAEPRAPGWLGSVGRGRSEEAAGCLREAGTQPGPLPL